MNTFLFTEDGSLNVEAPWLRVGGAGQGAGGQCVPYVRVRAAWVLKQVSPAGGTDALERAVHRAAEGEARRGATCTI